MARIRTIKPEFFTSEQVAECSPISRLLFIGMWNFCDDGGVHPASSKRLKMEVFPADSYSDQEIQNMVDELLNAGLLISYMADDGKEYWQVTGWQHQKIEKPTFRHPQKINYSATHRRIVADSSATESKGRESKGRESKEDISSKANGDFEHLWNSWIPYEMVKGAKLKAEKKYAEALKESEHEEIVKKAKLYCDQCLKNKTKTQHVATWLHQRGYKENYSESIVNEEKITPEQYQKALVLVAKPEYENNQAILSTIRKYEAQA